MAIVYRKFMFLATPRTGSNSLFYAIRALGGRDIGDHHDIPRRIDPKLIVVAAVRNHFDWFVTSWIKSTWRARNPGLQTLSFEHWMERLFRPGSQYRRFTYPGYVRIGTAQRQLYRPLWNRCRVLLHFEDLEKEVQRLLNNPRFELPRINTTPHKKDYRRYYSADLRGKLEHRYRQELGRLGYDFDNGIEWQPRDDQAPLTGGGLFNSNNELRPRIRQFRDWKNQHNNPD